MNDHDFPEEARKLIPYGIYDLQRRDGFIVCNTSHDTPEFAYNAIKQWWECKGKVAYPFSKRLLLLLDAGGSNSVRSRMFKKYMQDFSNETGLEVHVCHYPRGTSKWNPVEHRLFSEVSKNIQAKPLVSVQYAVDLMGTTATSTGLTVECHYDEAFYETGQTISPKEFNAIPIRWKRSVRKSNYWFMPETARRVPRHPKKRRNGDIPK